LIKKQARPGVVKTLLRPASMSYSKKFPNIFLDYYSMPDWLDVFCFGPRIGERRFESLVHEYQHAFHKNHEKLADILHDIEGSGCGRGLLHELAASRPCRTV
jgi:hypothetical protein